MNARLWLMLALLAATPLGGCAPGREWDAQPDRVVNEPAEDTELLPDAEPLADE